MDIPSTTERDLGRVEGKLDMVLVTLSRLEKKWDEGSGDADTRINKLDTRFKVALAVGVASFAASLGDVKHVAIALLHMAI